MSKKSLVDSLAVKNACAEDWNAMKGGETVRFCSHCNLNVNNISSLTRKQARQLIHASNGRLCVRYVKNPVDHRPVFADRLYQIGGRRTTRIAAATIAAALGLSTAAYAQGNIDLSAKRKTSEIAGQKSSGKKIPLLKTAAVSGTITDQQGAVIAGANVKLKNVETSESRTTSSNSDGFYDFQNVAAGKYNLTVEISGFKIGVVEKMSVSEGETAINDVSLEVSTENSVTVGIIAFVEYSSPLHLAVSRDDAKEVGNLIAGGARVNSKDENYDRITPLFLAVENGNREIAETLLGFGAKVNARSENGQTPLMRIDADATPALVDLLIKYGAKINVADKSKNTPLILAARSAPPEIVEILIRHGAEINAQDESGESALMAAADEDKTETVRMLLEAGADVRLKDEEGDTAYDYATDEEIKKLLKAYGAQIGQENDDDEKLRTAGYEFLNF